LQSASRRDSDINVEVNRAEAAPYGLTVGDVQRAITSGIGGENIAENIEGRERYPISIRYAPDFRDDIQKLERVVIATPSNAQVPLGELASRLQPEVVGRI
jgi:copper/silver efflux system protein